jgi:hypothetical protein
MFHNREYILDLIRDSKGSIPLFCISCLNYAMPEISRYPSVEKLCYLGRNKTFEKWLATHQPVPTLRFAYPIRLLNLYILLYITYQKFGIAQLLSFPLFNMYASMHIGVLTNTVIARY